MGPELDAAASTLALDSVLSSLGLPHEALRTGEELFRRLIFFEACLSVPSPQAPHSSEFQEANRAPMKRIGLSGDLTPSLCRTTWGCFGIEEQCTGKEVGSPGGQAGFDAKDVVQHPMIQTLRVPAATTALFQRS